MTTALRAWIWRGAASGTLATAAIVTSLAARPSAETVARTPTYTRDIAPIFQEIAAGRYSRYSTGMRSVVRDIFERA